MPDTPVFASAAVAAPHDLASEAGRAVLAEGGNAIEAMVAMAATIAVVSPHLNGLGGDGFWLVHEPGGRLHGIEAGGPAGALATIGRYRGKGYDVIPARGPEAAATIAGAVGGWRLALDLAQALGGRLPLRDLLADAIRHSREGYAVSASECDARPDELEALEAAPGFLSTFWIDGAPPKPGSRRRPEALGATLQQLADAGLDDFYRGDVGREIAADLDRIGAPVTRDDLERYRARSVAPLALKLPGLTVSSLPPPTRGLATLLALGIFERLGRSAPDSFEQHHGLIEATKRAFAIHADAAADPADLLSDTALQREAAAIDRKRAARLTLRSGDDGGAVWMGAIDGGGLAVSCIQSLHGEYGSGCVLPATGIHWHNRGAAFSLDGSAADALAPGRKPPAMPSPAFARFDDGRILSYGAGSGHGGAQILTHYRGGRDLVAAIDAPRWRFPAASATGILFESRFDSSLLERLDAAGHPVEESGLARSGDFGRAGMLAKHAKGRVEAAHDPRSDGDARGD